jgi:hypothetical protein
MKVKYCTCCGAVMYQRLQQFHNQDIGYSICADCVGMLRRRKDYDPQEFERCYGREGVNYPRVTPACNVCGSTRRSVKRDARQHGVEDPICCE